MRIQHSARLVRVLSASFAVMILTPCLAVADESDAGDIRIQASPETVSIAAFPCDRRGQLDLTMTNTGESGQFVDADLSASPGLELSRDAWSTYLPAADPDQSVSGSVTITADAGTAPGSYDFEMSAAGEKVTVPVTVQDPPADGPEDNLALYRQAFASTTHPHTDLCGGVDGNRESEQWADSGIHDRTPEEFPDAFGVFLDDTYAVSRVEVYTLDSAAYPAAEMGIRDFDVQVRTDDGWKTVSAVKSNEKGHLSLTFSSIATDQVRVLVSDSNDHTYSRLIELEVYQE